MSEQLKFAINLAKDARKILMGGIGKEFTKKTKEKKADFATEMDLEVEKMVMMLF